MNLAVLLYKDTPNDEGIPGEWPCEVRELGEGTELPKDGKVWSLMAFEEYQKHCELRFQEKHAWNVQRDQEDLAAIAAIVDPIEKENAISELKLISKGEVEALQKDPTYNPYKKDAATAEGDEGAVTINP